MCSGGWYAQQPIPPGTKAADHVGRSPGGRGQGVAGHRGHQPDQVPHARGPGKRMAVGVRDLRHHRRDPVVARGDAQHLSAAQRRAPQTDQIRIHIAALPDVGDGPVPVLELAFDVELLARLPVAGPELAIVEGERRDSGGGEVPRNITERTVGEAPNP